MSPRKIKKIVIDCFDVAVDIIGSEPEKGNPSTRETADHSMPYLVVAALLDGKVTLEQSIAAYERGMALKSHCESKLRNAQMKIEKIMVGANGAITTEKFDDK